MQAEIFQREIKNKNWNNVGKESVHMQKQLSPFSSRSPS